MGRGGTLTHTISGIDIALWDIARPGHRPAGRAAARRTLSRAGAALRSLLMDEPEALRRAAAAASRRRASAPSRSAGGRSAGATMRAGRSDRAGGARGGRRRMPADGRCRRQRCLLAAGLQVGAAHGGDAGRTTTSHWFEEPLTPDALDDYVDAAPARARADRRRRGADPPAGVSALASGRRVRHRAARRHQGRRHQRGAPHRLDGAGARRALHPPRLEHGGRPRRRSATGVGIPRTPTWSST